MDLDRRTVNSGAGLKDSGFVRFANQMSRDPYAQITNKATDFSVVLNGENTSTKSSHRPIKRFVGTLFI